MNTHDIELPAEFHSGNDIPVTQATIKRERMEEILRDAIEPYQAEIARLNRIIDSRPAINAGLPQTYIDWSHSIYHMEAARVLEDKQ